MKICVLGLGYVGLPLSISLAKNFKVTGYDYNLKKINKLKKDYTGEVNKKIGNINLYATNQKSELKNYNIYIICANANLKR